MMRSIVLAGALALTLGSQARANPAVLAGAVLVAEQVLPPLSSAVGIVIDIPKLWTTLQCLVDARALTLPPQPLVAAQQTIVGDVSGNISFGSIHICPYPCYEGVTGDANPSLGGR